MRRLLIRIALVICIAAGSAGGVWSVFALAPSAAEPEPERLRVPVEVITVQPRTASAVVVATGLVTPAREIIMSPEVSGRIVTRARALIPGGRLDEGELIARVDAREYRLSQRQEKSRVQAAELDLTTEKARQRVAKREWELLGGGRPEEEAPLALRRPHVSAREAGLDAAQSGLERARLNLSRTVIRAPWNAVVVEASAEIGQVVSPGTKVARLFGTDQFWVRASVSLAELDALDVPGVNAEEGSPARVIHELSPDKRVIRQGTILRLESELDAQTRMAQLLVVIDDPLDVPEGEVPLLPGSYVRVELEGRDLEEVFIVPRAAVRDGDTVWIVDGGSALARRRITVRWRTPSELFVDGLRPGDQVVTTNLSLPIVGTEVSVQGGSDG